MWARGGHPTDQTMSEYALGKLAGDLAALVNEHLESCHDCRRRAAAQPSDTFLEGARNIEGSPSDSGGGSVWAPSSTGRSPAVTARKPLADAMPPGLADHQDFAIIRELGRGGMGVVYLAHNRLMGRDEVLKVMGRHILERPGLLARFMAEIRAVGRLQHPNIVTAYSAFRLDESIVFSMEYVDGLDLAKLVKAKGPLPVAHACNFVSQAAQGMQHAHEQGMVHRDIKPGNLMLAQRNNRPLIKVLDFGLAKATREAPIDGGLTNPGQALGTPDYMAPEQIRDAQKADIRADIYSLGCTLYYLLSGGPPFRAENLWDLYQAHHSMDASPLNRSRADVPGELAALVAKMMAKEPERRFQSPAEVAQALAPFFKKSTTTSRVPAAELPSVDTAEAKSRVSQSGSIAPRPLADQAPSDARAIKATEHATPAASTWDSLIEVAETGSLAADDRPGKRATQSVFVRLSAAAAIVGLALIAAWSKGLLPFKSSEARTALIAEGAHHSPDVQKPAAMPTVPIASGKENPPREAPAPTPPAPAVSPPISRNVNDPPPASKSQKLVAALVPKKPEMPAPKPATVAKPASASRADVRHIASRGGVFNLIEEGAILPELNFWPTLTPDDQSAWQVADHPGLTMNDKGLVLEARDGGNYLITRKNDYRTCKLNTTLSLTEGTEAHLALRVHAHAAGWRGVTAVIEMRGGKIRIGTQPRDFEGPITGRAPGDLVATKPLSIRFVIDNKNVEHLRINGKEISTGDLGKTEPGGYVGAAGLFIRSGRVVMRELNIWDAE